MMECILLVLICLFLLWAYIDTDRQFWRMSRTCDQCIEMARTAISERDAAIERLKDFEEFESPYPSPFRKPFTSPRSGMGIKR